MDKREEIVENIAESICRHSNTIEEVEVNTIELLAEINREVTELVREKFKKQNVNHHPQQDTGIDY